MVNKTLTRQELYEKVWATPMRTLAKEFGISDRALAKKCDKHNIPKPPVGHWAIVQHGQTTKLLKLPINKISRLDNILFSSKLIESSQLVPSIEISPDDPRLVKAQKFQLPTNNRKYEESIRNFRKACKKDNVDRYGFLIPAWKNKSELDLKVTYSSYVRACQLLQGIMRLFKSNGWVVSSRKNKHNDKFDAFFISEGEEIKFRLKEKVKQIPHVLTPKELEDKKKFGRSWANKYDYINTGKFTFSFVGYWPDSKFRSKWTDKNNLPLEKQLVEITKGFIRATEATREKRREQEEQDRQYAIERKLARQRRR